MKCPKCGHTNTSVEDSRSALKDTVIKKSRKLLGTKRRAEGTIRPISAVSWAGPLFRNSGEIPCSCAT